MTSPLVLVVDDEAYNLQLVAEMLQSGNINVNTSKSGKLALDIIKEESPDLILLDVMMPEMDGFEVCRCIKNNPLTAEIPVIFLTAKCDDETIGNAFQLGGVDFIQKPIRRVELFSRVSLHLDLQKTRKKLQKELEEKQKIEVELRKQEKDLKYTAQLLQSVIDCVGEGITLSTFDGHFEIFNPKMEEITGYNIEDANHSYFLELIYPNLYERQKVIDNINELQRNKSVENIETQILTQNKEEKTLLVASSIIEFEHQTFYLSIYKDITTRKKAEMELEKHKTEFQVLATQRKKDLKKSEKNFSRLFNNSNDGILISTMNGYLIEVNQTICKLLEYTREEMLQLHLTRISHPKYIQQQDYVYSELKTKGNCMFEVINMSKTGKFIPMEVNCCLIDYNNQMGVLWHGRDISQRKLSEQALIESEEKFRNIFNHSSEAFILWTFSFKIIETNPAFQKLFGYSDNDLKNRNLVDVISPNDSKIFYKQIKLLESGQQPTFDCELKTKDGMSVSVEVCNKLLNLKSEQVILTLIRDITEHNQLDNKILRTIIETEERERNRFAKDLHDGLGPLLSTVKLYVKAIEVINDEEKRKYTIAKVYETVDEAILSIKEIANNISPHILQNFGLVSAIKSFCKKLQESHPLKIGLQTNLNQRVDENIEVTLFRVVVELIHNTLKHSDAKEVGLHLTEHKNTLTLLYADNGKGFDVGRILEGNHGIGLSNIFSRIKSLNGKVTFESQENQGVFVCIEINL